MPYQLRASGSDCVPLLLRFFLDGRVGRLGIKYHVETQEQAVVELSSRVFGHATDEINIDEKSYGRGKIFLGTREIHVAWEDHAKAEVTGTKQENGRRKRKC